MADLVEQTAERLKVFGNPTRLAIVVELSRRPRTPTELAAALFADVNILQQQLRVLRDKGLVSSDKRGVYSIQDREELDFLRRASPELFPDAPPFET